MPSDHEALRDKDTAGLRPFSLFNSRESRRRELHAIVAAGPRGEIGRKGDMPWHIPEDLRHFKELTMGHPVIMGRATWESLPKRPLPGRRNIVITSRADYQAPGAELAGSAEEAIGMCEAWEIPFVIGGGRVYLETLPYCTVLHLTRVDGEVEDADTFFPLPEEGEWRLDEREGPFESRTGVRYGYETYRRK